MSEEKRLDLNMTASLLEPNCPGPREVARRACVELQRADLLQKLGKFPKTIAMCNDFEALAVLVEEVGEVSHEVNETIGRTPDAGSLERLETELIQVAAMAIGWANAVRERRGNV